MRQLQFSRPARTVTGKARNAGEAAQQLAHITRERLRLGQERKALVGRIQKIDARLVALTALEDQLLPMMRKEADRAKGALMPPLQPHATPVSAASSRAPHASAAPPSPPVRRPTALPLGMTEVTLQY